MIKKTYGEKLRDPRWQKKRLEILDRDEFACTMCSDKNTELHIHHLSYSGEPWDAPDENLTTLCKHCHGFVESVYNTSPLVNKEIQKDIGKNGLTFLTVFTESGCEIYCFCPDLRHVMTFTDRALRNLIHFVIDTWLKTDNDHNLVDLKYNIHNGENKNDKTEVLG